MTKLANRQPDDPRPGGQNDADKAAIASVPKDYRADVSRLWMFNVHILPAPLVLSVRIQYWIAEHGLKPEEFAEITARLMTPERAQHKGHWDLIADITAEVGLVEKRRHDAERKARRTREEEAPTADSQTLKDLLANSGLVNHDLDKPKEFQ